MIDGQGGNSFYTFFRVNGYKDREIIYLLFAIRRWTKKDSKLIIGNLKKIASHLKYLKLDSISGNDLSPERICPSGVTTCNASMHASSLMLGNLLLRSSDWHGMNSSVSIFIAYDFIQFMYPQHKLHSASYISTVGFTCLHTF